MDGKHLFYFCFSGTSGHDIKSADFLNEEILLLNIKSQIYNPRFFPEIKKLIMKYFNAFIILMLTFFSLQLSAQKNASSSKINKPNIVYILADDIGYGDLGAYGQQKAETPNIDALAKQGMLFTQYYAMPVCAPSRYSLMTVTIQATPISGAMMNGSNVAMFGILNPWKPIPL